MSAFSFPDPAPLLTRRELVLMFLISSLREACWHVLFSSMHGFSFSCSFVLRRLRDLLGVQHPVGGEDRVRRSRKLYQLFLDVLDELVRREVRVVLVVAVCKAEVVHLARQLPVPAVVDRVLEGGEVLSALLVRKLFTWYASLVTDTAALSSFSFAKLCPYLGACRSPCRRAPRSIRRPLCDRWRPWPQQWDWPSCWSAAMRRGTIFFHLPYVGPCKSLLNPITVVIRT